MRILRPSLLLGAILLPAALSADTVIEEIIARVNNQIITRSEFMRSKEQLRQEVQQQNSSDPNKAYAEREKDVLRDLIDQQLLLEKGKDMGITADTELVKRLNSMRKEMNLGSMEELEEAAEAQGVSFEDFKQNMKNQIITQQVISKEVGSRLNLGKEDAEKFYEEHKRDLERPEEIRLSEILVSTQTKDNAPVDDATLAAAKAKADDLLAQIQKGAKFDDVAKKESQGPTAKDGGDLGYFQRGTLAKELEDKTFAMKAGDVSEVVRTKQGFVILKVVEHQTAGIPELKEIEPRIEEAVYMEKLQPALREYLKKLREDSFIEIKAGYVDSGASPNQTHIVETNTKDVTAKQLKKKKKMLLF